MGAGFESKAYLRHLIKAKGPHGVHSPYAFHLLTKVFPEPSYKFSFVAIESLRKRCLQSTDKIVVVDYGAGSRRDNSDLRSIADIAKYATSNARDARALASLSSFLQACRVLELGTSLGFTTAYLATALPSSEVVTLEGAPSIAKYAQSHFDELGLKNIRIGIGPFSESLPRELNSDKKWDLVIIDGHHLYKPTVEYVLQIVPYMANHGVIVLDDIHWSTEMERAWKEVCELSNVGLSIDFFHFGMLVFRRDMEKQHLILRLP